MTMDKYLVSFWIDYLVYVSFMCGLWLLGVFVAYLLASASFVPNVTFLPLVC